MRQLLAALILCVTSALALGQPSSPRMIAEWEPVEGVMIRWPLGITTSLVAEMAEEVTVFVIIQSHQIATATSSFTAAGVDMGHVEWFIADSYSHWSRDWGPQALFDANGDWGIIDPWFDGYPWIPREVTGYEDDDDTPAEFAAYLGEPNWQPPFYLTGGNIMYDGHGTAFCSEAQVSENDHLSESAFRAALLTWCGVDSLVVLPNTEGHGIQHIDCVAKFLDEETVMVKELYAGHPDAPHVEENAEILAGLTSCYGNPLEVHRVHCGPFGSTGMAAYTNSLILGKKVLVPIFNCSGDEPALQAYRDAMPGYEVIGFAGSWYYYDALHCRTMGIFDRGMLRVDLAPPPAEIPGAAFRVEVAIDDRSESGLDYAACKLHWRLAGEPSFQEILLAPAGDTDLYEAWIPTQAPGSELEYHVSAADLSGRSETRPVAAPAALYRTSVADDLTDVAVGSDFGPLRAWPQPFADRLQLAAPGRAPGSLVDIHAVDGRFLRRLTLTGGTSTWDGRDAAGRELSAGVYLARLVDERSSPSLKLIKLR
jgi:agmatine deiminase